MSNDVEEMGTVSVEREGEGETRENDGDFSEV